MCEMEEGGGREEGIKKEGGREGRGRKEMRAKGRGREMEEKIKKSE